MKKYQFPEGFLWGTAISAHQVEGNNTNCDWYEWEKTKNPPSKISSKEMEFPLDRSGIACDFYNRYEADFDLCQQLNNNAIRLSVEWARLEPKDGEFDITQFEHYRQVLKAAKDRGLKTFVTLHHFTNPIWFAEIGGWESSESVYHFGRYAKKCAEELGALVDFFVTINEPQVYAYQSYLNGQWYPCKNSYPAALKVQINMMKAHNRAYEEISSVNRLYKVGIVKNIVWYHGIKYPWDKMMAAFMNFLGGDFFLLPIKKQLDFIGLNFYFTTYINNLKTRNPDDRNSDLNWYINEEGLKKILIHLKRYNLPIYVTENGLADAKDTLRKDFIKDMLKACYEAIKAGAPLKGYMHWSLMDNFEWHHGYWPRFGLIEVDRNDNLKRIMRPSASYYADICKNNCIM